MSGAFGFQPVGVEDNPFGWSAGRDDQLVRLWLGDVEGETYRPRHGKQGWLWIVSAITGWWTPAPDATATFTGPGGDGVLAGRSRKGARSLTLEGWVHTDRAAMLLEGLDVLASLHSGTLVIDELQRGLCREADVRVTDMQETKISDYSARVTLTLQADDPLRYLSDMVPLTASTQVSNPGDTPAFPLLELTGPHGALSVSCNGATATVAATPSGVSRTVDMRHGVVWQAGVRVAGGLAGGLVSIPALSTSTVTVSGLGSGGASIRRYGAWS